MYYINIGIHTFVLWCVYFPATLNTTVAETHPHAHAHHLFYERSTINLKLYQLIQMLDARMGRVNALRIFICMLGRAGKKQMCVIGVCVSDGSLDGLRRGGRDDAFVFGLNECETPHENTITTKASKYALNIIRVQRRLTQNDDDAVSWFEKFYVVE